MTQDLRALLARKKAEKASSELVTAKLDFLDEPVEQKERAEIIELAEGEIDPRLKLLSHSSRCLLHTCPRKYQLYRLNSETILMEDGKEREQAVTFAYGKVVGLGMQLVLQGLTEDEIYLKCFLEWDTDLLAENDKQKKSFWLAMFAVRKFIALRADGFLENYGLVYYQDLPAIELSFQVTLPNGFKYRGFIDAVLQHRLTKEIMVLEAKTSSGAANSAAYKNSGQALGYSVVLDILFPELSSYSVLYLVYETKSKEYVELPFKKSLLQRALWLQELLIDTKIIEMFELYDTYPMHGESCNHFFRDCEYLSLCTLDTDKLTKPWTTKLQRELEESDSKYQFNVSFEELLESQLSKGNLPEESEDDRL